MPEQVINSNEYRILNIPSGCIYHEIRRIENNSGSRVISISLFYDQFLYRENSNFLENRELDRNRKPIVEGKFTGDGPG